MASLKAIRKRIASVKSTQKITRAMKLMAAARLRRAQEAIFAARPYARALEEVIAELAVRAGGAAAHPLLVTRPVQRARLIVITSDRGQAGAYNANVVRTTERFLAERDGQHQADLLIVGRKGREYFRRRSVTIEAELPGATSQTAKPLADEIAAKTVASYIDGSVDAVYLVYNEFKNAASQQVVIERLLPIEPLELPPETTPVDYLYEPSKTAVLDRILPMHVEVEVYRALLEAVASELGARMSAMDSATSNASEMINKLTLQYNRARQATITKELLDIIGGAEALKG